MPGQGIPPHVDTHSPFQEVFAAISLKSGTTMHFKHPDNSQVRDLYLKPRTLMVFSGEARYNWLHSIAQRKVDRIDDLLKFRNRRVSLTFRKVKTDPCRCDFPSMCDSQNNSSRKSKSACRRRTEWRSQDRLFKFKCDLCNPNGKATRVRGLREDRTPLL